MTEGKKTTGIKRHILVDTNGFTHGIEVTTANIGDRDGAIALIVNNLPALSEVKKILVDGGYEGENFANEVKKLLGNHVEVEVVKRNELHTFAVLPIRWVVERCFGWLDKSRRLWKNCERLLHTSHQMTVLAFLSLYLKRF